MLFQRSTDQGGSYLISKLKNTMCDGTVISKNYAISMCSASRELRKSEPSFTRASKRKQREKFVEMVHAPTEVGTALF